MRREILPQFLFRECQLGRWCLARLAVIQERYHCTLRDCAALQAGAQESYLIQLHCTVVPDVLKQPLLDFFIDIGDFNRYSELQTLLIYILEELRNEFCEADETMNLLRAFPHLFRKNIS